MVKEFNKNFRIGQGGLVEVTADITILSTNKPRLILVNATAGPVNVTLPIAAGIGGKRTCIVKTDASANAVTITANAADTVNGAATDSLASQFENVDYISDNENAWFKVAVGSGGGGGVGGNVEVVLDTVVPDSQILHSFNLSRSVAMDGSDVAQLVVMIEHIVVSAEDQIAVGFNSAGLLSGNADTKGLKSDGTTVTAFSSTLGMFSIITWDQFKGDGYMVIELSGDATGATGSNVPGTMKSAGGQSGTVGGYGAAAVIFTTNAFDPITSVQIGTIGGVVTINNPTRIVVLAITKN